MDRDLPLLEPQSGDVVHLFRPYVTETMRDAVFEQLGTRWVGQGPRVDAFEEAFAEQFLEEDQHAVAVASGTAGLHIAYTLALAQGRPRYEQQNQGNVIAPVFTCTATNLPWLYLNKQIRWADVDPDTLNIDVASVERLISASTEAISVVNYGGLPADLSALTELADAYEVPLIQDSAQALGATYSGRSTTCYGDYSIFSFQAIKHLTTGDGGLIVTRLREEAEMAKRYRWFGIDRHGKQAGTWANDVDILGFKYQMTDIAASMGVAGLSSFDDVLRHRRGLLHIYADRLSAKEWIKLVGGSEENRKMHSAWLATVIVATPSDRDELREALRTEGIESNPVHFRNDKYSVFASSASGECPNMDRIEGRYLCLPLHMEVTEDVVHRICDVIDVFEKRRLPA